MATSKLMTSMKKHGFLTLLGILVLAIALKQFSKTKNNTFEEMMEVVGETHNSARMMTMLLPSRLPLHKNPQLSPVAAPVQQTQLVRMRNTLLSEA